MMKDINSADFSLIASSQKQKASSWTASSLNLHHKQAIQYHFSQSLEEFRALYSKLAQ
jgi:hypothetical protein